MRKKFIAFISFLLIIGIVIINSCQKEEPDTGDGEVPSLTTTTISNITDSTASSGGTIIFEGQSSITLKGVCWSTSENPTTIDFNTDEGSGTVDFTSSLTGLTKNTLYYVRAYAANEVGTGYGNQVSFTTTNNNGTSGNSVTDADGNVYATVTIGTQQWFLENLKTTKYLNGDDIATTIPYSLDIYGETDPKYQWAYQGDTTYVSTYGRYYTWYALNDSRGVCPSGWHVPTDGDWTKLIDYLGGDSIAGGKLKEAGTTHWNIPNTDADNSSGFTALPSGDSYSGLGTGAIWWSATERISTAAWWYKAFYNEARTNRSSMGKSTGLSCRCVKD